MNFMECLNAEFQKLRDEGYNPDKKEYAAMIAGLAVYGCATWCGADLIDFIGTAFKVACDPYNEQDWKESLNKRQGVGSRD